MSGQDYEDHAVPSAVAQKIHEQLYTAGDNSAQKINLLAGHLCLLSSP